ncbi:lysozyme inhibitor LprI family protein [Bartonella sp. HY038]|uniref:lysozyme inhibitor LprI family protein n=1 Tax=Bartonella sp. HY038 TaxID=2759660 RepID=UPI0015FABA7A|nr:lysozyme inhibitor LprI family protein [Bartonella sp. HY038]
MSKIIYGLLAVLFGLTMFSSSKSAHADALYDKCLDDKADGTNFDWSTCGAVYLKRIDNDLNITWRKIIDSYQSHPNGETIKKQLIDQQRLWITFKEQSCQPFFDGFRGREGQVMHFFGCRGAIVEDRIAQLKQFYCNDGATCHFSDYEIDDLLSDIEISDRELNKAYQFIRKRLEDIFSDTENDEYYKQFNPPAISLRNEQRAWVEFKDKACLFMNDLNPDVASPKPIFRINRCKDLITRHRQEELSFYCDMADCFLPNKPAIKDNQWEIGCDQSYSCTAVGHGGESFSSLPNYIVIKWQYHSTKPAEIRFMLYLSEAQHNDEPKKDKIEMQYQAYAYFDDKKKGDISAFLQNQPTAEDNQGSFNINVKNDHIENIMHHLLHDKVLNFGLINAKDSKVALNLKSFQNFYQDTKDYVDFFYPNQVVSLPKVKAYRLFIDDINVKTPESLLPPPDEDACNRNIWSDVIFHASNGDHFYAMCDNTGAYNGSYTILQPKDNYKPYPTEKIDNQDRRNEFYNSFGLEKPTMTFTDFPKGRALGDCGIITDYSYTPDGFRRTKVTRMDTCAGIDWQDWPVVYNLDVEEIRQ